VAKVAGALRGRARVLDSTPLYDSVATQDILTQLRAAIRKLLVVLDTTNPALAARVPPALARDDDYATAGKPPCDWDDPAAREALVDELVHDALAALAMMDDAELTPLARDAAGLLALVAGQDAGRRRRRRVFESCGASPATGSSPPSTPRPATATRAATAASTATRPTRRSIPIRSSSTRLSPPRPTSRPATPSRSCWPPAPWDKDKPEVVGDSACADGATRRAGAKPAIASGPKCRPPAPPGADSPRTASPSTWRRAPSPARPTRPPPAPPPGAAGAAPTLPRTASRVRCFPNAPRHPQAAPSPSTATRTAGRRPGQAGDTAVGRGLSGRPAHRGAQDRPLRPSHVGRRKARCRGLARISTDVDTRAGALNLARLAVLGVTWSGGGWTMAGV
jgi:hypothetical protein